MLEIKCPHCGLRSQNEFSYGGDLNAKRPELGKEVSDKDWDNFVDQILPSRVASLFFFDGEKIEQLADLEESKKVLKKAINSLLGLEIVDQLNVDVDEFQKRSTLQIKDDDEK